MANNVPYQSISNAQLGLGLCTFACVSLSFPVQAQLIPDATLGTESSIVQPSISIFSDFQNSFVIRGGATRGTQLFHSFSALNVDAKQRVYFDNPSTVEQIFSRVTGSSSSRIDGTLGVLGQADLYLLNPHGIRFGEAAQLDIGGSFVGTTANAFDFGDGRWFSATQPEVAPLLRVAVKPGLQLGPQWQGTITSRAGLSVGEDLQFAGYRLDLQGTLQAGGRLILRAVDELKIRDTAAEAFIAWAGGQLLLQGDRLVDIFALSHPSSGFYSGGDMLLRSNNPVGGDAHYWSGGQFSIETLTGERGDLFSPYDPVIYAQGDVSFEDYVGASLHILAGGRVTATGDIIINDVEVSTNTLQEKIQLSDAETVVQIDGSLSPTLDIRAGIDTSKVSDFSISPLTGFSPLSPTLAANPTGSDISLNNVFIDAPRGSVFLSNQYQTNSAVADGDIRANRIFTDDFAFQGDAGAIAIDSRQDIQVNDLRTLSLSGNAGDINLMANRAIGFRRLRTYSDQGNAGRVRMRTGPRGQISLSRSLLQTTTFGLGQGGEIFIQTPKLELRNTSVIQSNAQPAPGAPGGKAGDIILDVGKLLVQDGSSIFSRTFRESTSGNLTITARDSIEVSGSSPTGLFVSNVSTNSVGMGNAGNIRIETPRLVVSDRATIASDAEEGSGNAGRLSVIADTVILEKLGELSTDSQAESTGSGGTLTIDTQTLQIQEGGQLVVETFGAGAGGNLNVNATESVVVRGNIPADVENGLPWPAVSTISSASSPLLPNDPNTPQNVVKNGDAGRITINTPRLLVQDGGQVISATSASGDGGNLTINVPQWIEVSDLGLVTASSLGAGEAGDLVINTPTLTLRNGGEIASIAAGSGDAGNISIRPFLNGKQLNIALQESQITAATRGGGAGGNLFLTAPQSLNISGPGKLSAETNSASAGGLVQVQSPRLILEAGATLSTSTTASGNAGVIDILVPDQLTLRETAGLVAQSTASAQGRAGDLFLTTGQLTLDQANITVRSAGTGDGGNIRLRANRPILLRQGSLIETDAGGNGNGGNISIQTPFLLALPDSNSDVIANAIGGDGGQITITADSILNLLVKDGQNRQQLRLSRSNDISASSETGTSGRIMLETPDVDPSRGLAELPVDLSDPSDRIAQGCNAPGDGSRFVKTGRGGIARSPDMPLSSSSIANAWIPLDPRSAATTTADVVQTQRMPIQLIPTITEAQQWQRDFQGEVHLLSLKPTKSARGIAWSALPGDC